MDLLQHTISFEDTPMDVDFHPARQLLATGLIDGRLMVHSYGGEEAPAQRHRIKAHSSSCRAARFALSGDLLVSASTDQSMLAVDVETGKPTARKKEAHDSAINRLAAVAPTVTASGDESGVVRLWDSRQAEAVASVQPHCDYVSDLSLATGGEAGAAGCLLSVSGDGTLAVLDLRTRKVKAASEGDADDELLSVAAIKGGRKLVCGSTSGVLAIWSWGYWNDCSDRFPGHPASVDAILAYDDDTIITGSEDGIVRLLSVQPNRMIGVLGEHADYPVERMSASSDRSVLATASHDATVKLWNLAALAEGDSSCDGDGDDDDDEAGGVAAEAEGEAATKPAGGGRVAGAAAAAADSGSSSDDDGDTARRSKVGGKKRRKGEHRIPPKRQHQAKGGTGNFFAGLL